MFQHSFIVATLLLAMTHSATAAELTVSAAASLTNAFKDIGAAYEKQYPHSKIRLNTAGSGVLLQQVLRGAPVDVVAFADQKTMDMAVAKQVVDSKSRRTFARNALVVAAPINSRLNVSKLYDLQQAAIKRIALSNVNSVPVGRYSKAVLEKAGLWQQLTPKLINTQHVRQSLDYVARGEVDVGFVYRTDAILRKNSVKILAEIPTDPPVSYPIAMVSSSKAVVEAQRFIRFVHSPKGRKILEYYGFIAQ